MGKKSVYDKLCSRPCPKCGASAQWVNICYNAETDLVSAACMCGYKHTMPPCDAGETVTVQEKAPDYSYRLSRIDSAIRNLLWSGGEARARVLVRIEDKLESIDDSLPGIGLLVAFQLFALVVIIVILPV